MGILDELMTEGQKAKETATGILDSIDIDAMKKQAEDAAKSASKSAKKKAREFKRGVDEKIELLNALKDLMEGKHLQVKEPKIKPINHDALTRAEKHLFDLMWKNKQKSNKFLQTGMGGPFSGGYDGMSEGQIQEMMQSRPYPLATTDQGFVGEHMLVPMYYPDMGYIHGMPIADILARESELSLGFPRYGDYEQALAAAHKIGREMDYKYGNQWIRPPG